MPKKTVLVVEDDPFLRETIKLSLEEEGIEVDESSNGEEAIDAIAAKKPDMMLLDLLMPKKDGYAVLSFLREKGYSFPIIILSNLSDYLDREKCLKLGAKDYFIKSDMDEDELWPKIQKYL